jgi:hypothetical protein
LHLPNPNRESHLYDRGPEHARFDVAQCDGVQLLVLGSSALRAGILLEKTMTPETERLASLRKKLAAREGKSEYAKNCEKLRAEIARLENCQELDL